MRKSNKDSQSQQVSIVASYQENGLVCIPLKIDGSKQPAVRSWKRYQNPEEPDILAEEFAGQGIAILCGEASGGIEVLDFDDGGSAFAEFCEQVSQIHPRLIDRLTHIRTPSGGSHLVYRCDEISGGDKLAVKVEGDAQTVLIETRGEGNYIMTVGSPEGPNGFYTHVGGPRLEDVPTIIPRHRRDLLAIAKGFDQRKVKERSTVKSKNALRGSRVGDRFNAEVPWKDILETHGWVRAFSVGARDYWRRPGKKTGWSATTGNMSEYGNDLLVMFTTSAPPFEGNSAHTKFDAFTKLWHDGDYAEAAKELGEWLEDEDVDDIFPTMTVPELLANEDIKLEYVIGDVLCKAHNGMLVGPSKTLKTTLSAAIGLAVVTGKDMFGQLPVIERMNVGFMSGESGLPTLKQTLSRIVVGMEIDPEEAAGMVICPKLPQIGFPRQLDYLSEWVDRHDVQLLMLDPAYLMMKTDSPENVYAMGGLLDEVTRLCERRGTTVLINHHTNQRVAVGDMVGFQDSAYTGFQQWTRQWICVNRRSPYEIGSGQHEMMFITGGSPGHSAGWDLTIHEDPWRVTMRELTEQEAVRNESSGTRRIEERVRRRNRVLDLIIFNDNQSGVRLKDVKEALGCSGNTARGDLDFWLSEGTIREKGQRYFLTEPMTDEEKD